VASPPAYGAVIARKTIPACVVTRWTAPYGRSEDQLLTRSGARSLERRSDGIALYALVVALVALLISIVAYTGRARSPVSSAPRVPATMKLSMVVATFSGQGAAAHRWYPTMLVVRQGDTVDLAVGNPDKFNHQLAIPDLNLRTGKLTPGSTDRLHFIADRPGVYVFQCVLPHNPAQGDCTPDHELMRGYLIVTE